MKQFISVNDVIDIKSLINEAYDIKKYTNKYYNIGKGKILGLIFFNNSLRTRLSTQKAAFDLGMYSIVLNINTDGWKLEFDDNKIMNGDNIEHIKDAAMVLNNYCDIIGVRCFASLTDKLKDYNEYYLNKIVYYINKPIISLESATLHPLQSFADILTIEENKNSINKTQNIVLAWAPHVKSLPQAVPNSFSEWICKYKYILDYNLTIVSPKEFELASKYTSGATISNNLNQSIKNADFIYIKNWSSYNNYGLTYNDNNLDWCLNIDKISHSNNAKIMHCLPVRRELELSSDLLDSNMSLIEHQVINRFISIKTILIQILKNIK